MGKLRFCRRDTAPWRQVPSSAPVIGSQVCSGAAWASCTRPSMSSSKRTAALKMLAPSSAAQRLPRAVPARVADSRPRSTTRTSFRSTRPATLEGVLYIAMGYVHGTDLGRAVERARLRDRPGAVDPRAGRRPRSTPRTLRAHPSRRQAGERDDRGRLRRTTYRLRHRETAAASERADPGGQFVGTVDYAAPEQIESKERRRSRGHLRARRASSTSASPGSRPTCATARSRSSTRTCGAAAEVTRFAARPPDALDAVIARAMAKAAGRAVRDLPGDDRRGALGRSATRSSLLAVRRDSGHDRSRLGSP